MACDAGNGTRCVADRVTTPPQKNGRIHLLHPEQHLVGGLGGLRTSVCPDRPADLPLRHESSGIQKKPEGPDVGRQP